MAANSPMSPKIFKLHHPVEGSISNLSKMVPPPDYGPMLLLQKSSHPYFLPLVECTVICLPHRFGKLREEEFGLLHTDWQLAFCTTQFWGIITPIICIIIVVGNLRQWGQLPNPCDICDWRFHWRLEWFHWEANRGSPMCASRRSRWRIRGERYWPIDSIGFQQSWRHSRCHWK